MRLAVLDTNVIVSAAINRQGAPAQLLMEWVLDAQIQVVTCPAVVSEYREVMNRSKFQRHGFPPIWLDVLVQDSLALADPSPWRHVLPDVDDAVFLALAAMSGAVLVTGNLRHYPETARERVHVMGPADYLRQLRAASS